MEGVKHFHQKYVYVQDKLKINLLGLPAITALNLAARMETTVYSQKSATHWNSSQMFSKAISAKSLPLNSKQMQLYMYSTHLAIYHYLSNQKYKNSSSELSMSLGVILKVDEPTSWCAGMVVVPQKNSQVHRPNHTVLH